MCCISIPSIVSRDSMWAISETLGSWIVHHQIWEGAIPCHTFVQEWCWANFGVPLKWTWCMCTGMTYPSKRVLLFGKVNIAYLLNEASRIAKRHPLLNWWSWRWHTSKMLMQQSALLPQNLAMFFESVHDLLGAIWKLNNSHWIVKQNSISTCYIQKVWAGNGQYGSVWVLVFSLKIKVLIVLISHFPIVADSVTIV